MLIWLVVLVAAAGIAAIGYVVFDYQKNNKETSADASKEKPPSKIELLRDQRSADEEIEVTRPNNNNFRDDHLSFSYPGSWTGSGKQGEWHIFRSADHETAPSGSASGGATVKGYMLRYAVREDRSRQYENYNKAREVKADQREKFGGEYQYLVVDGRDAIMSNTLPLKLYIEVTIFDGSYEHQFELEAPDTSKSAPWSLMENILDSVKFHTN